MKITKELAVKLGFKELPHFSIGNSLILDVGRRRYLSLSDLDNCNCMLYLCERQCEYTKEVSDLICLHNYDYDKELTLERLERIINIF